jgi:hypothetical protein
MGRWWWRRVELYWRRYGRGYPQWVVDRRWFRDGLLVRRSNRCPHKSTDWPHLQTVNRPFGQPNYANCNPDRPYLSSHVHANKESNRKSLSGSFLPSDHYSYTLPHCKTDGVPNTRADIFSNSPPDSHTHCDSHGEPDHETDCCADLPALQSALTSAFKSADGPAFAAALWPTITPAYYSADCATIIATDRAAVASAI